MTCAPRRMGTAASHGWDPVEMRSHKINSLYIYIYMGLAWQQWYKKIWDTKLIEYFWQYFDNHRIIDVIWQSIKWHVRAVWRSKLLLQCWSFSTTAPTTRIASKPWKPRQTMDQTSATSVEVPKRLSNFSPQTFFKSIQWGLQKFHKWCTHWKVEQSVFKHAFNMHFHHTIFDLMSFLLRRKLMISTGRAWVSVASGTKAVVPMASGVFEMASCNSSLLPWSPSPGDNVEKLDPTDFRQPTLDDKTWKKTYVL